MAWSVIRTATFDDKHTLEAAAVRFCKRHEIETYGNPIAAIDNAINNSEEAASLRRLWRGCASRALGHKRATGIAHGSVGFNVE